MDEISCYEIYQYIFLFHRHNGFDVFCKGFIYFDE